MSDDAILIIDDDADLRDVVRLIAEGTNVDVVEAATCREGIAALRANRDRIRLVLLDYFMPGMEPACCARELCSLTDSTTIVPCTAAIDPPRARPRSGSHAAWPSLSIWMPLRAWCAKLRDSNTSRLQARLLRAPGIQSLEQGIYSLPAFDDPVHAFKDGACVRASHAAITWCEVVSGGLSVLSVAGLPTHNKCGPSWTSLFICTCPMKVDAGIHGVLGTTCLVGLSLYVLGAIDWGSRGIALFTLLGFVWVLIVLTGLAAEQRRRQQRYERHTEESTDQTPHRMA